jgi:hypothetical protein
MSHERLGLNLGGLPYNTKPHHWRGRASRKFGLYLNLVGRYPPSPSRQSPPKSRKKRRRRFRRFLSQRRQVSPSARAVFEAPHATEASSTQDNRCFRSVMSPISSFYSVNEYAKPASLRVHHNNSSCAPGRDVPSWERRLGTGGYRACEVCTNLNNQGR